jgi:hypothetical protein
MHLTMLSSFKYFSYYMKLDINDIHLIFSYWIFAWYLLYEFKYIKYSPKLALIIGLISNTILLFLMIFYNNNIINILLFCIVQLFIKIIPLWRLRNNKMYDIKSLCILFIIYMIWLFINNTNIFILNKIKMDKIKNNINIGQLQS